MENLTVKQKKNRSTALFLKHSSIRLRRVGVKLEWHLVFRNSFEYLEFGIFSWFV